MTILLSVTVFNIFQVTAVDVNKNCSLTLNECLSGLNVHLYRVTSVSKDGTYAYTDEFKNAENTSINLNKLETSEDLKAAAMTLKGYAASKEGITQTTTSSTLTYSNLNTGLYLVVADNLVVDGKTYTYLPYLISLPQGTKYDVSINFAKHSEVHSHEYKIIKQWKDNGSTHPKSIEVELYDGNTFLKTVTLDAAHNYSYSWKTEQAMNYSIKEKNVKGYKGIVSVSSNDAKTEYVITNTSTSSTGSHVKTGDTTRINHWVTLMALSGLFLLIVGTLFRHEKD
ncbi:MAG: Cna B-type domain-containing protein [Catenibacterium sp.]|nr:Cna B-type domain-containing protein [Catenibacterium sp.]